MISLNVDLLFHHRGKWTINPQLLYEEKYFHSVRTTDSDHLSLITIEEEITNNLGFVKVKQILVKRPSEKLFLIQDSDIIRTLLKSY